MLYWRLSYFVDPFTMSPPPTSFAQEREEGAPALFSQPIPTPPKGGNGGRI